MIRDSLDSAVKELLALTTGKQVGMSQVPAEVPELPYAILYQSPSPGPPEGSWKDPEDEQFYDFLIKSVGRSHRQVAWMSSRVHQVLVGRGPSGNYEVTLTSTGVNVMERSSVSKGAIIRVGDALLETNDIYRIRVVSDA